MTILALRYAATGKSDWIPAPRFSRSGMTGEKFGVALSHLSPSSLLKPEFIAHIGTKPYPRLKPFSVSSFSSVVKIIALIVTAHSKIPDFTLRNPACPELVEGRCGL